MLRIDRDKVFTQEAISWTFDNYLNSKWLYSKKANMRFLESNKYDMNIIFDIIKKCSNYDKHLWDKKQSLADSINDKDHLKIVRYKSISGNENHTIGFDSTDDNNNPIVMSIFCNDTMKTQMGSQAIPLDNIISEFAIERDEDSIVWLTLMFCIYYIDTYCNDVVDKYENLRNFLSIESPKEGE